ncbi:DUF6777 domain-containing protein [Streptomyces sp. cmx-18-6]|uniref:DUF6777 domain-containing protein n=1 Tax=Streptomyces sp. cmx-18-6 TaxID=2790930 RepID=UPI00397EBB8F
MSEQPPSSGRPTGPPSGPLSGPSQSGPTPPPPTVPGAPPGPPSGGDHGGSGGSSGGRGGPGDSGGSGSGSGSGSGGSEGGSGSGPGSGSGSGAAPDPGPGRPWWRSVPRIAAIVTAVVVAVGLVVFLTRPDDGGSKAGGEVFLQPAGESGPDPFTESTARESDADPESASPSAVPSASATGSQVTRGVDGAAPGLYGGTRKVASCDVEKQIKVLRAAPDKNRAFASVQDIEPSAVPDYLRALTPVQLRMDTRVTNHGFRDGKATPYQAVLQAGTAVLVDDRGVPRVRCACGNPLLPPVAQEGTPKQTGKAWPGYRASDVVVVKPSSKPVDEFKMVDPDSGDWFTRPAGDTGGKDEKTAPPDSCPGSGDDPNRSCPPTPGEVPPPRDSPSPRDGTTPPGDRDTPPGQDTPPTPRPDSEPAQPDDPPKPDPDTQPAPPEEQQPDTQSAPLPQNPGASEPGT